jgi:nucleoid-associated protein YgaU
MALNVKAAMLVSLGFVGGMSWLLHGTSPPPVTRTSPLAGGTVAAGTAWSRAGRGWRVPGVDVDRPVVWAQQLEQESAVERSRSVRRGEAALAYVPATDSLLENEAAMQMPALVFDPPRVQQPVVAVADEGVSLTEWASAEAVDARELPSEAREPEDEVAARRYRVARGDTLMRILRREWGSDDRRLLTLLLESNPRMRERPGSIYVGEQILLPDEMTATRVLAGEWSPEDAATRVLAAALGTETGSERWYTIQRNDSLTSIARRFLKDGRRWREILDLNDDLDPDRIFPGVRIKLPPMLRLAAG